MTDQNSFGGQFKESPGEAFADIPANRTLFAERLTSDEPFTPQAVHGLTTLPEVFSFFKPSVTVFFQDRHGAVRKEAFLFSSLKDFHLEKVVPKSKYLQNVLLEKEQYVHAARQLKAQNKLRSALEDPAKRKALTQVLRALKKSVVEERSTNL